MSGQASIMSNVLATILIAIYKFLYHPGDLMSLFTEYNDIISEVFSGDAFAPIIVIVKSVGVGFLVAASLMDLMDKVTAGDFSPEVFFRTMIKYFMLYIVVMNASEIFTYLLDFTSAEFEQLSNDFSDITTSVESAFDINKVMLANGLSKEVGFVSKLSIFMMALIPYVVSQIFTIIMCFFATSRVFEIAIRTIISPLVAGLSFFGHGNSLGFVKFVKRSMGIMFQIIVILGIIFSLTFVHNKMVGGGAGTVPDPADILKESVLEPDQTFVEPGTNQSFIVSDTMVRYTGDSINEFIQNMLWVDHLFLTMALMLSGLKLVFKSREISTSLFT